jgi:polyisoprenoid-binding protein YceI
MKRWLVAFGMAATLAIPSLATTSTLQIDPAHSNAQFVVRHLGISNVQGDFTKISGTVTLDEDDISKSSVTATIDVASVDTRVQMRDNDLKGANFFDVANYPTMTFQSTKIWKTGDGTAKMTGNLTLHGVTKEVTFDVTGPTPPVNQMGVRRGAEATAKISRKDFGINADPMMVGDEIAVTLDIEMVVPGSMPGRGGRGGDGRGPAPGPAPQQ